MQSEPLQLLSNDVFQSNSGIKWMHGLTRRECASMPSSDIDLEKLYQEHFSKIYNYFFYQDVYKRQAFLFMGKYLFLIKNMKIAR